MEDVLLKACILLGVNLGFVGVLQAVFLAAKSNVFCFWHVHWEAKNALGGTPAQEVSNPICVPPSHADLLWIVVEERSNGPCNLLYSSDFSPQHGLNKLSSGLINLALRVLHGMAPRPNVRTAPMFSISRSREEAKRSGECGSGSRIGAQSGTLVTGTKD